MSTEKEKENKKYRRQKFTRQLIMILEEMSRTQERIPFEQFDRQFFASTTDRFEDIVDELRREFRGEQWTTDVIFKNLKMVKHTLELDYLDSGDLVLIIRPNPQPLRPPREIDNLRAPSAQNAPIAFHNSTISLQNNSQVSLGNVSNPRGTGLATTPTQLASQMSGVSLASIGSVGEGSGRTVHNTPPIWNSSRRRNLVSPTFHGNSAILENSGNKLVEIANASIGHQEQAPPLFHHPTMTSSEAVSAPPTPVVKRIQIWADVKMPFQEPNWPGKTEEFRKRESERYRKFLNFADGKDVKDPEVLRHAKYLATDWWSQLVRNFPQLMHLLKRIATANPDGFDLRNIEQEVESVYPQKWLQWNMLRKGILSDFHIDVATLVEMNLIVQCDVENSFKFKVNTVVEILALHHIIDPECSLIYQHVSESKEQSVAIKSLYTFLRTNYRGWAAQYNETKGCERIRRICEQNHKMFFFSEEDPNSIYSKDHMTKIPLPMCFHSLPA